MSKEELVKHMSRNRNKPKIDPFARYLDIEGVKQTDTDDSTWSSAEVPMDEVDLSTENDNE